MRTKAKARLANMRRVAILSQIATLDVELDVFSYDAAFRAL